MGFFIVGEIFGCTYGVRVIVLGRVFVSEAFLGMIIDKWLVYFQCVFLASGLTVVVLAGSVSSSHQKSSPLFINNKLSGLF